MVIEDGYSSFGGLSKSSHSVEEADLIFIGIPYEGGTYGKKGTYLAPKKLREMSKNFQTMSRRGIDLSSLKIKDVGDIPIDSSTKAETRDAIKKFIKKILETTSKPIISVGGDHSIALPEMQAYSEIGTLGVIWIDAHRDLLDELYGSKYSHGSPLRRAIEAGFISPENVLLIGIRYNTTSETQFLKENNMTEISMVKIEETADIRTVIRNKISQLSKNVDNIFLSIDIDGVDPAFAPGTGYPVAGGISSSLLLNIIHDFPVPLRGVDIVEVSPPLDNTEITMKLLMAIITEICAKIKSMNNQEDKL